MLTSLLLVTGLASALPSALVPRDDCRTIQVESGNGCDTLASRCGISGADFTNYNPDPNLCSTLQVGQYVCCSAGSLPDRSPKQNPDGTCSTYTVQDGEYCSLIASSNSITVDQIEGFNKATWGWSGCDVLQTGQVMCLSSGTPPMPSSVDTAICGPQVPGTPRPTDMAGSSLAYLNPCPLNACCDKWGQCGTTDEFCTVTQSATGAPGTSAPGTNGCISNCGTDIVNNGDAPGTFRKVGYFEAWNAERPCLNMDVTQINLNTYDTIHFAFGKISEGDFTVDISEVQEQFSKFTGMSGVHKVLSFGGWSFSTDQDSYPIFRDGVTDANRQLFANNVASFISNNNLDGVDFDWEYPGAPDIPGIPPGSPNDGANYLQFLKYVRAALPSGKTMSIAAPASFWYLKGFPIKDISDVVDYIVFMTYDLHGQWDYQSAFSDPGCPEGSCLRSHVNLTETLNSLSMVTKAGVPASKILVGIASYGRSFQIADGCTGPNCHFTGPSSGAQAGECTGEPGYISNAELAEILNGDPSARSNYDAGSDSMIMTWGSDQWVAYMDDSVRNSRISKYTSLNFGGWVEWAIDLGADIPSAAGSLNYTFPDCTGNYATVDAVAGDAGNIPDYCMNGYLIGALSSTVDKALSDYNSILASGYDDKFQTYSDYTKQLIPQELEDYVLANGDKYFTCQVTKNLHCCKDCLNAECGIGCTQGDDCVAGERTLTEACPTCRPNIDFSASQCGHPEAQADYTSNWTWTLKDHDGFFNGLAQEGIIETWIDYESVMVSLNQGCSTATPQNPCTNNHYWNNYPQLGSGFAVPNPKDNIGSALGQYQTLDAMLKVETINSKSFAMYTETSETVDGASVPVLMAQAAVGAMQAVVKEANEIEAEERKAMILNFILGFLMLVPAVGAALDAAALATLGRIVNVVGEVGNAAVSVYGIVEDPKSFVFDLFGALVGKGDFEGAAKIRRGLKDSDINAFGQDVAGAEGKVSSNVLGCI